jgi:hypothetical protein
MRKEPILFIYLFIYLSFNLFFGSIKKSFALYPLQYACLTNLYKLHYLKKISLFKFDEIGVLSIY